MEKKPLFEERNLVEMMRPIPHFSGLGNSDLIAIIRTGKMVAVRKDKTIFWEGDSCAGLHVLLRGEVHLHKHGPSGQESIMAALRPVTMFNEVAVLDGGNNPATAIAFSRTILWRAERARFQALMTEIPNLGLGLLPILAKRNRWLVEQYEDMCFRPVKARTAKLLLELSRNGNSVIDRSSYSIEDLSARVSTSPEVISRTLSLLSARGVIETDRRSISIVDPDDLLKMAGANGKSE
jgi:CRP/FNR family transcriptional regulator